jgi:hypothetical protein
MSPLTLTMGVARLALVACVGVLVVHPPDPDPVPRPVTYLCEKTDWYCQQLLDEAQAIEAREGS